jgi:hypothetical protein
MRLAQPLLTPISATPICVWVPITAKKETK